MKHVITVFAFIFSWCITYAQSTIIEVADLSVKVPGLGSQEFLYGFETGDELIFNFSDLSKKGIKQIEIIEYPNTKKFSIAQTASVDKRLKITKRGVYIFKFTNSALSQRVCAVKIGRIPFDAKSINFNTNISWKEISDTTYTIITKPELIRYDTTYSYVTKKELIKIDTTAYEVFNRNEQVAAQTTIGKPSESYVPVTLPENKILPLETSEVVSWAYWIGVGQEGHLAFEANKKTYLQAAGKVASMMGNPLLGLALNQFAFLPTGNAGSNVAYYFMQDFSNAQIFVRSYDNRGFRFFEKGDGVSAFGRREIPLQGTFFIGLHNDNIHNQINVDVRVAAVVVKKKYEEKRYRQANVTPRYENKIIKQPTVSIKKVPVNMN